MFLSLRKIKAASKDFEFIEKNYELFNEYDEL